MEELVPLAQDPPDRSRLQKLAIAVDVADIEEPSRKFSYRHRHRHSLVVLESVDTAELVVRRDVVQLAQHAGHGHMGVVV
jgi:hypothetical protein